MTFLAFGRHIYISYFEQLDCIALRDGFVRVNDLSLLVLLFAQLLKIFDNLKTELIVLLYDLWRTQPALT